MPTSKASRQMGLNMGDVDGDDDFLLVTVFHLFSL